MKWDTKKQVLKRSFCVALSFAMTVTLLPSADLLVKAEETPLLKAGSISGTAETVTEKQPFVSGVTGERDYFSAPALIVKDRGDNAGNLVVAADAKYDTTRRAGGVDVVASVSADGGENWTYSYPMRFMDSSQNAQKYATTINNPVLVEAEDGTIYCLANVNPTGVSAMVSEADGFKMPKAGTGYITIGEGENAKQRLALTDTYSHTDRNPADSANQGQYYTYYVGDWGTDCYAPILNRSDNAESSYYVDKWYNLYKKEGDSYTALKQHQATADGITAGTQEVQQNVFYAGSEFHVYNTSYIMCVTSADGKQWSDPEILNPYVKVEEEQALLIAPGKGLRTSAGRLVVPVYSRNSGTEDAAGIIWLDLEGNWQRSGNVQPTEDITSSSDGEIVEISNGYLRMLFRNNTGLVCYADAVRNENNIFEFSEPVSTGANGYSGANVTAVEYTKTINGRNAILVAVPAALGRVDGKIYTFLGKDDEKKSMSRSEAYDVPRSSSFFGNSCLNLLNDGNQAGLLWENTKGGIRYDSYNITDIVKEGYIPDVEIDVRLNVGETYTREYTVVGEEHLNGVTQAPSDQTIISHTFQPGTPEQVERPILHTRKNNGTSQQYETYFNTEADTDADITKAEFTIMQPNNKLKDAYSVYNEAYNVYLTHTTPTDGLFTSNFQHYMEIHHHKDENANIPTLNICRLPTDYLSDTNRRQLLFDKHSFSINGNSNWTDYAENAQYTPEFTFLEKIPQEETGGGTAGGDTQAEEAEWIKGYRAVNQITPGKKYLIACGKYEGAEPFTDGGVILLYPRVGSDAAPVRLVSGKRTVQKQAVKTLTITANAEGEATLVANDITYRVACRQKPNETLELAQGGTRFFDNVNIANASSDNPNIISVEAGERQQKALFDCEREADHSLSGYSTVPNWDLDMSVAEFKVESSGDNYTIYNQAENTYLMNTNGSSYFGTTAVTHSLNRVENEDGTYSFEIRRVSNDDKNNRYVYFYYPKMGFDALNVKNDDWIRKGDFSFEFLEKKNSISNLDPIPGYQRVSQIQSGHSYLITEYYHDDTFGDVIIVLYPRNGITNQSKLCRTVTISGVLVTAVGLNGQKANITIGEDTYEVTIRECTHEGYAHEIRDAIEASCETAAYTGDTYCTNCNKMIQEGTRGEPLGHSFGSWTMTTVPTAEANGERTHTCSRCGKTEKETVDKSQYITDLLAKKIAAAKRYQEKNYTPESYAVLKTAYQDAEALGEAADIPEKFAAVAAIDAAIAGLERVLTENIVTGLKPSVRDTNKKNYFSYTAYSGKSWSVFDSEAYIDLGASDDKAEQCFYEIHFEGNAIAVFAVKQPAHGKVKFTVDGAHEQTVDLYNESKLSPAAVYTVEGLQEGVHTLKAVTLNAKSGSKIVNQVSYAEVTHQPYIGGVPDLGGMIGDTNTQYTQDRYSEVSASTKKTEELSAWKNDKATSEIVLYSKSCSLDGVSVTAGDLRCGSETISADHIKTTFISSTKAYNGAYLGYGDKTRPVPEATTANRSESSDILRWQGGEVSMEYDSLLPVWVEFNIPKDAKAGTYTGTITATAEGIDTPLSFTYTVNVKDVTLPDASEFKDTFDIELWQYPYSSAEYYNVKPFSEEHLKIMESSMEIYKSLGGHAITTSIVEEAWSGQTYSKNDVHYPSMVKWTKNGDSFTYDYTDFDKWVSFCEGMGLGDKIVLYSIAPWHNSFTYWEGNELKYESFTAGSERYRKVWGDFLKDLISHLEEKKWFDKAYIGIDERGFSAAAFDLIDSIHNSKGEPLKTAGAMDGFVNKKDLALRVNDLNVGDNAAAAHAEDFAKLLAERKAAGLRTTLYSCTEHKPGNFSLSAPVESYWGMVNAAKMGTAGFLRWAYDAWVEDPLNDTTHNAFEPGDCFLIYPDEKDAVNPVSKSSVRLERMAEGIRDVNKLIYLEQEMPSLAAEIQSLYNSITTTASTGRSYLAGAERTKLIQEMEAFKTGLNKITDEYIQFSSVTEPGLHLLSDEKEMKIGQKYTIPVKLITDQADKTVTYQSANPSIASVDASGSVTARKLGNTEITLKAAGYTAVMTVSVTAKTLTIKNTLTDYKLPEQYLSDVEKAPNGGHERHYLGQPDMVMLDDNQTLITVFPIGHGRGSIVLKMSYDAGETWVEKEVPSSWLDSFETPTIYKLNMTDGTTKLIVISGRPSNFGAPTGGWDTSISTDGGETWSQFETFNGGEFTDANNTVVAMASLVQLKDDNGNYIDKWMGVYHNGGSFINYKTYLTFDEEGNQHWSVPEPYLSEYRSIEQGHQICEVGMFRSPDEKRIVALARSQSHNNPATMFYSDDEGETWSQPVDLPGSLAGERHKAMYDPTDPTGQRLIVTFREIKYDQNNNNQFDGGSDWLAGDWLAWVGTYDQLMNLEDGMYRILLCEDWAANAKSGDTGYTGIVVQPDGTFIMDSYGHWDKEYSESLPNYSVYNDMCWIKQAKFKLSAFDEQVVPSIIRELNTEINSAPAESEKSKYTESSYNRMKTALDNAKAALTKQTQSECFEALYLLKKMKGLLVMKGLTSDETPVTNITITPAELSITKIGSVKKLNASIEPSLATDQAILWKSDHPEIAAVSNKGAVMAVSKGTAIITAMAADGSGVSKSVTVTVTDSDVTDPVKVSSIVLEPDTLTFNKLNTKKTIRASVQPEDADNKNIEWSSNNETVATVSQTGEVTAKANGTAKITATAADGSGVKAEAEVEVNDPDEVPAVKVTKITFSPKSLTFDKIGDKKTITATVLPADAANKNLTWSSDNETVATVSQTGEVTAKANGTAKITAAAMDGSNVKAEARVIVNDPDAAPEIKVTSIVLDPESLTFDKIGEEKMIEAQVKPSNASNLNVVWKSENEDIAKVSEEGVVTSVADGETKIIAEAADGSGVEAEAAVKVDTKGTSGDVNYKVIYDANQGVGGPGSKTVSAKGFQQHAPNPTRKGYTFIGWYTDKGGTKAYRFGSPVTSDITLYAKWKIQEFTVQFNLNYGSKVSLQKIPYGSLVRQPANPTRAGYKFIGWYKDAQGKSPFNFKTEKVYKALTLYAKWQPQQPAQPAVTKGMSETIGIVEYEVEDAVKRTVIIKKADSKKAKKVKIPETVNIKGVECTVVGIGNNAFKNCKNLTRLTISKNVTKIGKKAFWNCKKLKTVIVKGKALKTIQSGAFKKTPSGIKIQTKGLSKKQKKTLLNKFKKAGMKKAKIK